MVKEVFNIYFMQYFIKNIINFLICEKTQKPSDCNLLHFPHRIMGKVGLDSKYTILTQVG